MKYYSFEVVIEKEAEDEGYYAYSPTLPGCFSNSGTIEDAKRSMREAITQHLERPARARRARAAARTLGARGRAHRRDPDMTRMPQVTARELIRSEGFVEDRKSGSHLTLRHPDRNVTATVPVRTGCDIGRGLAVRILKDAGFSIDDYLRLR